MWTPTTRKQHIRETSRYQTDVTDEEWLVIMPHLPSANSTGRPRAWPMREIINGIFYVMRKPFPLLTRSDRIAFAMLFIGNNDATSRKGMIDVINRLSPSAGDAQFPLDFGHHRMRQARLAEFHVVIGDDALPHPAILRGYGLTFVGKVQRLRFLLTP